MPFFRVDNRLVHGQVTEAWLPYTGAKHLVVANDALAEDLLRQQIISLAVPQRVHMHFVSLQDLPSVLQKYANERIFVLLEHCQDVLTVFSHDVPVSRLNIGNLHYAEGKRQLLPHVAVTDAEILILQKLSEKVTVDFRSVPTEKNRELHELLS